MGFFAEAKRFIFWDFARGSWQYDVIVAVILGFLFLTPRDWFLDQPRISKASDIAMLPAEHGSNVFWIEPELLAETPEPQQLSKISEMLKSRTGKAQVVTRVEKIFDSEKEVKGYMAFTRP
ncbi:MAG: hypothetical protein EXQ52_03250 [Bryobacterales bacterium]|nr:hypothetical protein [Bryobacterales bacterium]